MEALNATTTNTQLTLIRRPMKQLQTKRILLQILINIAVIVTTSIIWQYYADNTIIDLILFLFLLSTILIFVNLELIINQRKLFRQKRSLKAYRKYIPVINDLIIEVRNKQKKHLEDLQHIEKIVEENDEYEKLSKALDAYSDELIAENVSSNLLKINYKLLAGVLFTMIHKAAKHNVTLDIRISAVNFSTSLYEYQLVELVEILVDNAVEATPNGTSCYLTLGQQGDKMQIRTANPGPIATPEYIHKIFSEGYTSKNNQLREHGIGLTKLRKIVTDNSGEIIVDNEVINDVLHICFEIVI